MIEEVLSAFKIMVTVPVWTIAALGVISTLAGISVMMLCFLALTRGPKKSEIVRPAPATVEAAAIQQPARQERAVSLVDRKGHTKPVGLAAEAGPPPAQAEAAYQLSEDQVTELERRTAQRINYTVSDAATLLNVEPNTILRLLANGKLSSIISGDGVRWIRSDSITSLLFDLKVLAPVREEEEEAKEAVQVSASSGNGKNKKQSFTQFYWYFVEGSEKGIPTLREAVLALGVSLKPSDKITWEKLKPNVRSKITREKIQSTDEKKEGEK